MPLAVLDLGLRLQGAFRVFRADPETDGGGVAKPAIDPYVDRGIGAWFDFPGVAGGLDAQPVDRARSQLDNGAAVLDTGGLRIPGLFAGGELVGGIFYGNYLGGAGLMSGSVFGRQAGQSASEFAFAKAVAAGGGVSSLAGRLAADERLARHFMELSKLQERQQWP